MNPIKSAACLVVALALVPAHAASVPKELIDVNTQACEQMNANPQTKAFDTFAPADAAKVPAYCSCYSKAYWDSVPQADYDGMVAETRAGDMKGPHSVAIRQALHSRNEAAKKSCQ